jgi:hypothetical protein
MESSSAIWYVLNRGLLLLVGFTNSKELVLVFHLVDSQAREASPFEKGLKQGSVEVGRSEDARSACLVDAAVQGRFVKTSLTSGARIGLGKRYSGVLADALIQNLRRTYPATRLYLPESALGSTLACGPSPA